MESSSPKRAGLASALILARPSPTSTWRWRRGPAGHRQGVRRRPDDAGPGGRRLLARPCDLGAHLGALGDRYGRKLMLLLGMGLSIPASLLAGFAPSIGVLFVARLLGGVAAGMAFPTTLR